MHTQLCSAWGKVNKFFICNFIYFHSYGFVSISCSSNTAWACWLILSLAGCLCRLIQFVLTKTAVQFKNMLYEQITERTMRRTCAQNYVIITMEKLEIKFLAISRLQPLKWWRYIDDIYMIWPNTLQELSSYLEA